MSPSDVLQAIPEMKIVRLDVDHTQHGLPPHLYLTCSRRRRFEMRFPFIFGIEFNRGRGIMQFQIVCSTLIRYSAS